MYIMYTEWSYIYSYVYTPYICTCICTCTNYVQVVNMHMHVLALSSVSMNKLGEHRLWPKTTTVCIYDIMECIDTNCSTRINQYFVNCNKLLMWARVSNEYKHCLQHKDFIIHRPSLDINVAPYIYMYDAMCNILLTHADMGGLHVYLLHLYEEYKKQGHATPLKNAGHCNPQNIHRGRQESCTYLENLSKEPSTNFFQYLKVLVLIDGVHSLSHGSQQW